MGRSPSVEPRLRLSAHRAVVGAPRRALRSMCFIVTQSKTRRLKVFMIITTNTFYNNNYYYYRRVWNYYMLTLSAFRRGQIPPHAHGEVRVRLSVVIVNSKCGSSRTVKDQCACHPPGRLPPGYYEANMVAEHGVRSEQNLKKRPSEKTRENGNVTLRGRLPPGY